MLRVALKFGVRVKTLKSPLLAEGRHSAEYKIPIAP